jgi:hypothetical protein
LRSKVRRAADKGADGRFPGHLVPGEAGQSQFFSVAPLHGDGPAPAAGRAMVSGVSTHGRMPELRSDNRNDSPVLLLNGESRHGGGKARSATRKNSRLSVTGR